MKSITFSKLINLSLKCNFCGAKICIAFEIMNCVLGYKSNRRKNHTPFNMSQVFQYSLNCQFKTFFK